MKKILLMLLIPLFIFPVFGDNEGINIQNIGNSAIVTIKNPVVYTTFVDQRNGFYKVYEANQTISTSVSYENNTLHINVGDMVIWQNDANPDTRFTITSEPYLFTGVLPNDFKRFGYTFNESGIYKIYIKEFPSFSQIIIVGEIKKIEVNNSNKNLNNQKISNGEKIGVNISANVTITNTVTIKTNSTVINSNLRKFPDLDTIVLFVVLISMTILSKKIEVKYCNKKR